MQLCVGAASRRVVEEAAKLHVPQIVASRRQVNVQGGYIGLTPKALVNVVRDLSSGQTKVVRDHGGPGQGGFDDDGVYALGIDQAAGFDVLHLDVSALPTEDQPDALLRLMERFKGTPVEIGGERNHQGELNRLMNTVLNAGHEPRTVVVSSGMHIWADRQCGTPRHPSKVKAVTEYLFKIGITTKMHNADWVGDLERYVNSVMYCNIAPEFGAVEVDAFLITLNHDGESVLRRAYATEHWRRWFHKNEGTWLERAKCSLRYIMTWPEFEVTPAVDTFIRERIRDAIIERRDACLGR